MKNLTNVLLQPLGLKLTSLADLGDPYILIGLLEILFKVKSLELLDASFDISKHGTIFNNLTSFRFRRRQQIQDVEISIFHLEIFYL
jgi:hypothetical protein